MMLKSIQTIMVKRCPNRNSVASPCACPLSRNSPGRSFTSAKVLLEDDACSPSTTKETMSPGEQTPTGDDVHSDERPIMNNRTLSMEQTCAESHEKSFIMTMLSALLVTAIALAACSYHCISTTYSHTDLCDMTIAKNRDFHKFYGLYDARNRFTDIVVPSVLPQVVLKPDHLASSFIVMEKLGSGKTLLRCEYFKVLILNKQLNENLERFVGATSPDGVHCESADCLMGWLKEKFGEVLLSELMTRLVDEHAKESLRLSDMSIEEKIEVITILCYYYNGEGVSKLENLANFLLKKTGSAMQTAKKAVTQVEEHGKRADKHLLKHFKADMKGFSVQRNDVEKVHLLLSVVEKEGYQYEALSKIMHKRVFKDLTGFTLFIKAHLHLAVVFVIDDIDVNRYFYHKNTTSNTSLNLFLLSSVSEEIQSSLMARNFYLSLFYSKIDGIDIQSAIKRRSEFPTYPIEWNTPLLINYADHLLAKMNKTASAIRCKALTSFETLVNYADERTPVIIDQLATPRDLHYFMITLIFELNTHANVARTPFVATFDNVKNAFHVSRKNEVCRVYLTLQYRTPQCASLLSGSIPRGDSSSFSTHIFDLTIIK